MYEALWGAAGGRANRRRWFPRAQLQRPPQVKSSYKINGVVAKRKEVVELAEHFNLQVENPCAILTQTVHATFLRNAKDGRKRYDFFLAACNLDMVRDRLLGTMAGLDKMTSALEAHRLTCAPLAEETARCRALVEKATQRDRLEKEVCLAERELAWAEVRKVEAAVDDGAHDIGALRAKQEALAGSRSEAEAQLASLRVQTQEAHQEREQRLALIGEANKQKKEAADRHRRAQRGAAEAEGALAETERGLQAAQARQAELRASYERGTASMEDDRRAAVEMLEARREAAEANAASARGEAGAAGAALDDAAEAARQAKARSAAAAGRAAELKRESDAAGRDLHNARAASGNVLRAFDDKMPLLVDEIRRARWPSGVTPTGPIGAHVWLKPDQRDHAYAVEVALGRWGGLSAFVVENTADECALRQLIGRVSPSLKSLRVRIQRSEARFRPRTESRGFPSVLDAIDVEDDRAFNALLNACSPEDALLIGSYDDARALWATKRPFRALEPDGTLHQLKGSLQESSRNDGTAKGLVAMDSAVVIQGLEGQHAHVGAAASEASAAAQAAGREAQVALKAEEAAGRVRKACQSRSQAAERELAAAARAALADEVDDRLGQLREDVHEMEAEVAALMRESAERHQQAASLRAGVEPAQRVLRAAEAEVRGLGGGHGSALDGSGLDEQLKAATATLHKKKQALERAAAAAQSAEVELEARRDAAAGVRAKVEAAFPEKPPAGAASVEALKKKLDKVRAALRSAEKAAGGGNSGETTFAALVGAVREAEAAEEAHGKGIAGVAACAEQTQSSLRERHKFHRRTIKAYGRQATQDFARHLSHRALGGSLTFDHTEDSLEAEVSPNVNDIGGRTTASLRSLSGGEQAFSTLSLILAMWQLSATPLRAMDEFDKNMDSNYQTASLTLLFETFRRQPGRQFLILTPLDYSTLLDDAGVQEHELLIHRMPEVVR